MPSITPPPFDHDAIENAAEVLRAGGIVAYPTEAVYGLGCDPRNDAALRRLLTIKQRSPDKGLIIIAASLQQLEPLLKKIDAQTLARIQPTWPGPVTWLLPCRDDVSPLLRGAHTTLAARVTAHPVARALCLSFGGAIVSTSANRSGDPPARNVEEVRRGFADAIDLIVAGPLGDARNPSEIRDAATGAVLRPS